MPIDARFQESILPKVSWYRLVAEKIPLLVLVAASCVVTTAAQT